MTDPNPYAAPQSQPEVSEESRQALGELVKSWEKLRLIYNGVLLLPGIGVLAIWIARAQAPLAGTILTALLLGLAANAAFFAGPFAELYLRAIFLKSRPAPVLRRALLTGGFLISFGTMAIAAVVPFFAFK